MPSHVSDDNGSRYFAKVVDFAAFRILGPDAPKSSSLVRVCRSTSASTSVMAVVRSMARSSAICRSSSSLWASKASSVVFMRERGIVKSFSDFTFVSRSFLLQGSRNGKL